MSQSAAEPQKICNDAEMSNLPVQESIKAPWVNLFTENHKHDDRIKLEKFVKQYGQVILDDQDLDEVEDAWGSCLVSYFARRFPSKMALIQLCNSYKVKYQYYVHNSG